MAAIFATLFAVLAVQQAGVLANSWSRKDPTVVEVVRYGQACPCAKRYPFELEVPVKPQDPVRRTYGYAVEAPPPRQPLELYSYDYELEVPVKKRPPIRRTYGYAVEAPPPRQRLPLYSYDYELEVPARSPEPPKLHDLEARVDRVLLPRHDCPWGEQAGALHRSARNLGYGYVEADEEPGAGRVVPLAGPTRILPTSGPALAPREEFYDGGKTYEVVHSSPLALISGGDGGYRGAYAEDLVGLRKPWSPLQGPAYFAASALGRDFRTDLHFAPERPRIVDEPPAGRYQVNRYGREGTHPHHPELEGNKKRSRRAVSVRYTLSEGYDSLEEDDDLFVQQSGRQWRGKYVTDRARPYYTWQRPQQTNIVDPDDLDDLVFRHPLDRYFTKVKDWKEVADFNSKVLGRGDHWQGFMKSPSAPWWRPSRPTYRPAPVQNAVINSFQQEASDYHLSPAPKVLPKNVYSRKVLPNAAYDEGYKVGTVRPKTVYTDNYRPNGFDSQFVGNELNNRFGAIFQDQSLSSSNVNVYSPAVVPYFGRLGTYTLGPFAAEKTGNGLGESLLRQGQLPTKPIPDEISDDDFSLDEVDRQLLEEERKKSNKKVDSNFPEQDLNSVRTSKPLPSDIYSLKVLPDQVVDNQFSLEEVDKVQMLSLMKENSKPASDEFSPDMAPLRRLPGSKGLNLLPNNEILPGNNILATMKALPNRKILPTTKIVTNPDLLRPSPNAFANYAHSVISERTYNLNTMPRIVSGKVNQLNTFSSLLSDEFHLLDRGPNKLLEKKDVEGLNSIVSEDVNGVLFDGERRQSEVGYKNSIEEPQVQQYREAVGSVAGADTVTDVLADSVNYETVGNAIEGAIVGSGEAVRQKAPEELKDVDSLRVPENDITPEQIPVPEASPNADSPVEYVESTIKGNTFAEEQVVEDTLVAETKDASFPDTVHNCKEKQEGLLGGNIQEEAIINENEQELLGAADNPESAVVEELGSAVPLPVEPSNVQCVDRQNTVDTPQLSELYQMGTQLAGQELNEVGHVGTQKVETKIVPLEALQGITGNSQLDDHNPEVDAVDAATDIDNDPWYGLWYGHGDEVKSEGLPKLNQLHEAILERKKHVGEKADQLQQSGKISPEQITESSPNPAHNGQQILEETNPVKDFPVVFPHHVYPQEVISPEAVFDYYPTHASGGKVHQPHTTKSEMKVHNEKWPSYQSTYSSSHFEESTHASQLTASPKTSSAPHTHNHQSWYYPHDAFDQFGEKWGIASAQQPLTYSHSSKSDHHTQSGHEGGAAPKFGMVRGNPKYLQHPNSKPSEMRGSDGLNHKVRGESYANTL